MFGKNFPMSNKVLIYADHAATTQLSPAALDAMLPFLQGDFGNPSSLHSWARGPREAVQKARATIAECIGAEPEEIFFTSGGTESDNWVIKGTHGGVMVSAYEHHAVLNAVASEASRGRKVVHARPEVGGYLLPDTLAKCWTDDLGLVSIMTANNEIGIVNPIQDLAEMVHRRGALFHTDAVQAVGHIPLDVRKTGVDFLSASAHKFNGPRGVGFLFARRGVKIQPLMNGGQQESGMRAGTENVASIVGMAKALEVNCAAIRQNTAHLVKLAERFRNGVRLFCPEAICLGADDAERLPGFISIAFPGHSGEGLMHMLDLKGIAVSTGAACDSKNTQVSHVLAAIDAPRSVAESTLRITWGPENTAEEVDAILSALRRLL